MALEIIKRDHRGASLVEFTIIAPILFSFIVIAFELLICCYISLTTNYQANTVLRKAVVGPHIFNVGEYNADGRPYEEFIIDRIQRACLSLGVEVQRENISIQCMPASRCEETAGQPGVLVSVEVLRPTTVLTLGVLNIRSVVIARNEMWET